MDELTQIISQVVMNLDHNDKAKIIKNIKKKEIIEHLIKNLLKDYENDKYEDNKIKELLDNEQHILLLSNMYH